jgi:hypothetical protein
MVSDIMPLVQFEGYINKLKESTDRIDTLSKAIRSDVLYDITDHMFDMIVDILEICFNDKGKWIEYWVFELDFGNKYKDGMIKNGKTTIPLKTVKDLYDLLKG